MVRHHTIKDIDEIFGHMARTVQCRLARHHTVVVCNNIWCCTPTVRCRAIGRMDLQMIHVQCHITITTVQCTWLNLTSTVPKALCEATLSGGILLIHSTFLPECIAYQPMIVFRYDTNKDRTICCCFFALNTAHIINTNTTRDINEDSLGKTGQNLAGAMYDTRGLSFDLTNGY